MHSEMHSPQRFDVVAAMELPVTFKHLKEHKAEREEHNATTKPKASVIQRTPLALLRKEELAVLAVCCYSDLSSFCVGGLLKLKLQINFIYRAKRASMT